MSVWYHGSKNKFASFDSRYMDEGGIYAFGVGFYFSKDRCVAEAYSGDSGYIYKVSIDTESSITVSDRKNFIAGEFNFSEHTIRKIIELAPDYKDVLSNFYELGTDFEFIEEGLDAAVKSYLFYGDHYIDLFNALCNDFYSNEIGLFAKRIKEVYGISGVEVKGNGIHYYIAFDPADIEIISTCKKIKSTLSEENITDIIKIK